MKRFFFILFFVPLFSGVIVAQEGSKSEEDSSQREEKSDSKRKFSKPKKKIKRAPIEWYKIINHERDTTYLDTTLSIQKEYKYNYLRKDNFELISFVNIGRPYVQLAKQKTNYRTFPKFGSRARSLGFFEVEDINYYSVPTPLTDLYYKTVLEQGQQLDAFLSVNTSSNLNFSVAYKGVRSLGDYRSELTSTRALRSTLSYNTPNQRYVANLHFVEQSISNQENGGFTAQANEDFKSGRDDFNRRTVLDLNIQEAFNELEGRRFYIDHEFRITKKDSLQPNQLSIAHQFNSSKKEFKFYQATATPNLFGDSQREGEFNDRNDFSYLENSLGLKYSNKHLGNLSFMLKNSTFKYSYNSVYITGVKPNEVVVPNRISDNLNGFTGSYKNTYKGFLINAKIESTLVGTYKNQFLHGTVGYKSKGDVALKFGYKIKSEAPEINKFINQSNYIEYNWINNFENTVTNSLIGKFESKRFFDAEVTLSNLNNYTYFSRKEVLNSPVRVVGLNRLSETQNVFVSTPIQTNKSLRLLKLKVYKKLKYRKFGLINTLMYQEVDGNTNNQIYNVPSFVTRNTLYYQNALFKKKALFFQLGATFRYYSKYYVDGYDPLLGDNYTQNTQKFGETPLLDVFLNAKVRQTRIFFKLENAQYIFEQNNNLLAPNTPTRDFLIRFGLVWNFFL